jgi:hypothetical protein
MTVTDGNTFSGAAEGYLYSDFFPSADRRYISLKQQHDVAFGIYEDK